MFPIYLIPIIFIALMFTYYSWEYNRLKSISKNLDKILHGKKTDSIKFHRNYTSIYSFDKVKLITKIESQLDSLLKYYKLPSSLRRYSYWTIQFNSSLVYESFNRKLEKVLDHLKGDKLIFRKPYHFSLLFSSFKILDEIERKLDKINHFDNIQLS